MNRGSVALGLLTLLVISGCGGGSPSPSAPPSRLPTSPAVSADWPEYHGGPGRSGIGPAEPGLGSPQVAWNAAVDGEVYASPLVVDGHVLVATENNTIYSFDLFSGAVVWSTHLGAPVAASSLPCGNITPVTGITGTPAVDTKSGRLYVVAFMRGPRHVLFTLNVIDGSVIAQRVIDPVGSTAAVQQQRGALAIGSGYVYVTFGGLFGDCGNYHGYVVGAPLGGGPVVTYRTPVEREAGIWGPAGPTIDASGALYVVTGNGSPTQTFAYSNAVIKLAPDLHVQSYFAPANWANLDAGDVDMGSVGATLLPGRGLVVAAGKEGVAYLLKADELGGVGGQLVSRGICNGAFGGTARSDDETMVWIPCVDGLIALSVSAGSIGVAWRAARPRLGSPILAAGVLWAIEPDSGRLYALDPASGSVRFTTNLGAANHFSTPAAVQGFVIAPAGTHVVAISTGA